MTEHEVVKIGGSLLDVPELPGVLGDWLGGRRRRSVLVVGGGRAADAVRDLDARLGLGEEASHWLAVRAMQINTLALSRALGLGQAVDSPVGVCRALADCAAVLIDPLAWLQRRERAGEPVPHRWSFTSDSIAAAVAQELGGAGLVLLKSTDAPVGAGLTDLAAAGVVDSDMPMAAAGLAHVELVNLRSIASDRPGPRSGP